MSSFIRNFSFICAAAFAGCSRDIVEPQKPFHLVAQFVLVTENTDAYTAFYLDDAKHAIDPNGPLTAVIKPAHQGDFIPAHEAATVIQWDDMMNYTKTDPVEDTFLIYDKNKVLVEKHLLLKSPADNRAYFKGKSVNQIHQENAAQTASRANAFLKNEIRIR